MKLVITGMGAVTPIGFGVENYWRNLISGKSGTDRITRFDATHLPVNIAAEVKDFEANYELPKSVCKSSSLFMRYAYAAAEEALIQAGIKKSEDNSDIGICMGTALAGCDELAQSGIAYGESETGKISPHLVPKSIANMVEAHLAINWGMQGPGLALCTACSAGGDALMSAAMLILSGEAKRVLVCAGESILTASVVSSLAQAKALSRRNDDPQTASRPFDKDRDGFVIGEGGGAVFLESESSAIARGAKIHAVLAGWGNTLDGYHITAPMPDGKGAALCMRRALARANLAPDAIGYINAHGTSTILGDVAETRAILEVFGPNCPPVSSTKGATGHLMGAGGLTEIIACIMAINTGILPPTINLFAPAPECFLDYIPNKARKASITAAMSNSLGFGGQNSSIIVTRFM